MANKLPKGKGTGKTNPDGPMSIGGFISTSDSFNDLPAVPKEDVPKISHPGKGNGSGSAPMGPPLRP